MPETLQEPVIDMPSAELLGPAASQIELGEECWREFQENPGLATKSLASGIEGSPDSDVVRDAMFAGVGVTAEQLTNAKLREFTFKLPSNGGDAYRDGTIPMSVGGDGSHGANTQTAEGYVIPLANGVTLLHTMHQGAPSGDVNDAGHTWWAMYATRQQV